MQGRAITSVISFARRALSFITTEPTSTIIAGVFVFIICEWAKEIWLTPLQNYKKIKANISQTLILHAQYYANPLEPKHKNADYDTASHEIRLLAAELAALAETIPLFHPGIPKTDILCKTSNHLIGLSNNFYTPHNTSSSNEVAMLNYEARKDIIKLLNLRGLAK